MATRIYQPEPMHRFKYTRLTENQISRKLRAATAGPSSHSPFSAVLAGNSLRIVTDKGPVFEYTFHSGRELSLSIDGVSPVNAGYGALELKQLVLFSHMVPGTQKGYNLIVDWESNLATVVEVWFSGWDEIRRATQPDAAPRNSEYFDWIKNREVQREMYYGYVDNGGEEPSSRHHITNRLEGKGVHWTKDDGEETLDFYCTVLSSNFIELTRRGGELTFCGPSDYIMINDHQFIYSRVEAEHSGTFTLYLIDLFGMEQAGVRLGFDEADDLEYVMYRGEGEVTGQIATFEVLGNNGKEIAYGNRASPEVKGQRLVYRPMETFPEMTDAEVREQVLNNAHAFGNGEGSGTGGMGGYKSPIIDKLVGKELTIRMDKGPAVEYRFDDLRELRWRNEGERNWNTAFYEAYEPDEDLYFFAHLKEGVYPGECNMVALDMKNGLSTLVHGKTGTLYRNNETTPTFYFGIFEMEGITPARYHRHGWTEELVGEAVTWNYQPGDPGLSSMHLYLTPHTYSWVIFLQDGSGGMQLSSPGWYSKARDGVYIMAWVEEACNGTLGVICFNKYTMHDAGFGFHVGPNGLSMNVIGARARHAGKFDIEKYIGIKT